jgi:hypothetical protein
MNESKLVDNEDEHDIMISLIYTRTRSSITRQKEWDTMFMDQRRASWNAEGSTRFSITDC